MGLDITAYSHLKHVSNHQDLADEYCEDEYHVTAYGYKGFDRSYRGLEGMDKEFGPGLVGGDCYTMTEGTERHRFRAGSYSGYGAFREALASLVGPSVADYWQESDPDLPFYEIINFADNEGTIGPDAARDLLEDFRTHRDAFARTNSDSYWLETYDDWITALELASNDGLVDFH